MDEIKDAAKEYDIELTYSLGLDKKYDISSCDESVRLGGVEYLKNIMLYSDLLNSYSIYSFRFNFNNNISIILKKATAPY